MFKLIKNFKVRFKWYFSRLLATFILFYIKKSSKSRKNPNKHKLPAKLVLSLTSYKPRFDTLYYTLKCLTRQSVLPDSIILWVSEKDYAHVPNEIMELQSVLGGDLFSVKIAKDNGPYTKIIPSIENYPEAFVVTADDDLFYSKNWLKHLLQEYDPSQKEIVAYVTHEITMNDENTINPYVQWELNKKSDVDEWLGFPAGYGGVLYPPGCFDRRVVDEDLFLELSPKADDPWLYWMAKLNGYKTKKTREHFLQICWPRSQAVGLLNENVANNSNDWKIANLSGAFGSPSDFSR